MGRQIVPDPAGEYSAETGTGSIIKVERDPAKRNAQVFIRADHLERPIRGWLDTHDLELLGRLERAQTELGGRVAYRIDVRRTDKIAADLPWSQVGQTDRFRRLVDLADEHHLADLLPKPVMATVGAPAEASTTSTSTSAGPGPGAQPGPAPAAPTSPPQGPDPAPDAPTPPGAVPTCCVCGTTLAGRPVKRTPRGYIHADGDCLTRPFDGDGFEPDTAPGEPEATVTGQSPWTDPAGGIGVLAAGLAATAQRQAHYQQTDGTTPPADPGDPADDDDGVWHCDLCDITTNEDRPAHEAGHVHQGKARQAEQAGRLRTQRQAAETRRAAENPDPARFDAGAAEVAKPPRIPIPTARGNGGPRVAEGKPWEKFNTDGSLNMGSYGITASIGMVELAQRLCVARLRAIAGDSGEQQHLDLAQVRALANYLLEASDRVQAAIRDDGRYDRMDNSHTRARGAVRTAIDVYPVPWDTDAEARARWVDDLAAYAAQLIRIAIDLDR